MYNGMIKYCLIRRDMGVKQYLLIVLFKFCTEVILSDMSKGITKSCVLNFSCKLPCRLTPSYPNSNVEVRWFNGRNEMLSRGYKMVRYNKQMKVEKPGFGEFELNILKLTRRFADTYTCKTTDDRNLSVVTVALEHRPTIEENKSSPAHVIIREHSLVELKCIFSGLPEPDIVWHRGSTQKLIEGIKGPKLIIRNVPRYASDNYTCNATNDHGFKEKSIQLTVQFLPEVSVMESVIHVAPSEAVTMGCAIQASPMKEAFWINSKGQRITTDWKYEVLEEEENDNFPVRFLELRIKQHRISVHDMGNYTCHAEGENGGTNKTVLLVVNT